jgi:hypothetical protein
MLVIREATTMPPRNARLRKKDVIWKKMHVTRVDVEGGGYTGRGGKRG